MFGFFRYRGRSGTELIMKLRQNALMYADDIQKLWELTPCEIIEITEARRKKEQKRLEDLYRMNELLAFNIGALCRTAVNAPLRFPKSLKEAYGKGDNS